MPDKERERRYFDLVRRCVDLPTEPLREAEPPDFVVGAPPRAVGVELTEYHHPAEPGSRSFQEVQSLKERIVERAEKLYAANGGPALYLTAIFGRHGSLYKRDVPRVARALADAVSAVEVPRSVAEGKVDIPWESLPREIATAWVFGSVDGHDRLWKPDHVGWVQSIQPEHLQAELNRKERVVPLARLKCNEVWLVMVHNSTRGAPSEVHEETLKQSYRSSFDRVLWLDPHGPQARDLSVSAPESNLMSTQPDLPPVHL